jgi:Ser/Thr protein kinase RdoA (MazF antagonist)
MRAWLKEMHRTLPLEKFDALPAGWLHGDYHGRNLLFRNDGLRALLDFDIIERGPYALDIARAIFSFGRPARGSQEIRTDSARQVLQGYAEVRPLHHAERRGILALMDLESSPYAAYYQMLALEGEDSLAAVRRDFALLRERRRNAEELSTIVLDS